MENTKLENHTITLRASDSIEAACELFEADLRQGDGPVIEQYLTGWDDSERKKLLCELLKLEIQYGIVKGETTAKEIMLARFPEHGDAVMEAFASTIMRHDSEEKLTVLSELQRHAFLGQGGLGIVYKAKDRDLHRDTAVKFIQESLKNEPRSQEQFRLEAEITGQLEHPGIVPVHGLGKTADGRMFYVMRLIHGDRLDEAIAKYFEPHVSSVAGGFKKEVRFHELLSHFIAVCKTIGYAHKKGVIHRDIKPGNIMLGKYGETVVIDWGLGAKVDRTGVFKDSGEKTFTPSSGTGSSQNTRGGTPPYMSPEQAAGKEDLGPSSDIYSLGATLYTLLTGKIPFVGSTLDIMNRVMRGDFVKPTEVNPGVSKALEAICLKSMSLNPQSRYTTALELAEDVERFMADAPVKAYEEPRLRKLARWVRRHRSMAQTGLFGLIMLAGAATLISGVMVYSTRQANHLRAVAEESERNEQELRLQSLKSSAEFAAQSIANQVDVRWRVLEREAANSKLSKLLADANTKTTQDGYLDEPIQKWLDERINKNYRDLTARAWTIYTADGSLIARNPNREADGSQVKSMGQRFAYRDYFHGEGQDYKKSTSQKPPPLNRPHRSAVFQSVSDDKFVVILSVPIMPGSSADDTNVEKPLGVMTMSFQMGDFARQMHLPDGQLMIVEGRPYTLEVNDPVDKSKSRPTNGFGLVLHHENLASQMQPDKLPRVSNDVVEYMNKQRDKVMASDANRSRRFDNLIPASMNYEDPIDDKPRLAAFRPVLIENRPKELSDIEWIVVVQQSK